jgi:Ni/Co efflux regulator RcnB
MHLVHRSTLALLASFGMSLMAASVHAQPQPPQGSGPQSPSAQRPGTPSPMAAQHHRPQAAPAPQVQRPGLQQAQKTPPNSAQLRVPQPPMPRGAGPDHRWERGTKVPAQYRSQHYVVNDWRRHGLHQPGRGQHWIQHGGDYLLVSIATGVIAQLVLAH